MAQVRRCLSSAKVPRLIHTENAVESAVWAPEALVQAVIDPGRLGNYREGTRGDLWTGQ